MPDRYDDEARRLRYVFATAVTAEHSTEAIAAALREAEQRGAREMRERARAAITHALVLGTGYTERGRAARRLDANRAVEL